jgi:hypothetical protein
VIGVGTQTLPLLVGFLAPGSSSPLWEMRQRHRLLPVLLDYCGCAGAVGGGGLAVGAVGVEPGRKYQTMSSATATAAAIMSNLFVSMESPQISCRTLRLRYYVRVAYRTGVVYRKRRKRASLLEEVDPQISG